MHSKLGTASTWHSACAAAARTVQERREAASLRRLNTWTREVGNGKSVTRVTQLLNTRRRYHTAYCLPTRPRQNRPRSSPPADRETLAGCCPNPVRLRPDSHSGSRSPLREHKERVKVCLQYDHAGFFRYGSSLLPTHHCYLGPHCPLLRTSLQQPPRSSTAVPRRPSPRSSRLCMGTIPSRREQAGAKGDVGSYPFIVSPESTVRTISENEEEEETDRGRTVVQSDPNPRGC